MRKEMTSPGIRQILKGLPHACKLVLNHVENDCWLIGCFEKSVFTTKLPGGFSDDEGISSDSLRCSYQEYTVKDVVVGLFKWSDKYHLLDAHGFLYRIGSADKLDDTADFFEDSSVGEESLGPTKVYEFDLTEVLTASFIAPNFIAIIGYKSIDASIVFCLYSLVTYEMVNSAIILCHILSKPKNMFMEHVIPNEIEDEFVTSWFPYFNPAELSYGYVFIFNCNESISCIQLGLDKFKIGFFFTWTSFCVYSSFSSRAPPGTGSGRNSLLLAFEDGAIVKLSRSGGEIYHFTLPFMKSACRVKDAFICSDYTNCHWTNLLENPISRALPLKGVTSFCLIHNSDRFLALTSFGGLYSVKLDNESCEDGFLIPELSSFEETIRNIDYLDQLNSQIVIQNRSIKCVAIAANARNLRFHLDVQVIEILSDQHVVRVTCELLNTELESMVMAAEDWHIVLTASSKSLDKVIHVQQLQQDFSKSQPLVFLSRLKLRDVADYIVSVKLIAFFGGGKYRPTVPLGKVYLSMTSFLQSGDTSIPSAIVSIEASTNEVLLKNTRDLTDKALDKDFGESVVRIPLYEMPPETFVNKLLEKSQALWRTKAWNDACTASDLNLVVRGTSLTLSMKDATVTISSRDPGLTTLMKYATLEIVNTSLVSTFSEKDLVETENLLKNLEIVEFSESEASCSNVCGIYRAKVEKINDPMSSTVSLVE